MKFWSDATQQGFTEIVEVMSGSPLVPINNYVYDLPDELLPLAEEWGATPVGDQDAQG